MTGQVSAAWEGVSGVAQSLIGAAEARGGGLLTTLSGGVRSVGAAILSFDADRVRSAWGALTGVAGSSARAIRSVGSAAVGQLQDGWDRVKTLADGLLGGLQERAAGLLESLPGAAAAVQDRLSGAWETLTGSVGGVLESIPGGSAVAGLWERARSGIAATATSVVTGAQSAWSGVQAGAGALWQGIQTGWEGVRTWAGEKVDVLVSGFGQIEGAIRGAAVDGIAGTLSRLSGFYDAVRQAIADPRAAVAPFAEDIAARLQDLPQRSRAEAQTRIGEAAPSGGGDEPGAGGAVVGRKLMRQGVAAAPARRRGGPIELVSSVWEQLGAKLSALFANLGEELLNLLGASSGRRRRGEGCRRTGVT